jgi:hypothetical protein
MCVGALQNYADQSYCCAAYFLVQCTKSIPVLLSIVPVSCSNSCLVQTIKGEENVEEI